MWKVYNFSFYLLKRKYTKEDNLACGRIQGILCHWSLVQMNGTSYLYRQSWRTNSKQDSFLSHEFVNKYGSNWNVTTVAKDYCLLGNYISQPASLICSKMPASLFQRLNHRAMHHPWYRKEVYWNVILTNIDQISIEYISNWIINNKVICLYPTSTKICFLHQY